MDETTVRQTTDWIKKRFSAKEAASRDEIERAAREDGLPDDVRDVFHNLPQGEWSLPELLTLVRDEMLTRAGAMRDKS